MDSDCVSSSCTIRVAVVCSIMHKCVIGDLKKLSLCAATPLPEEIGGGNKRGTPITPDFYVGSNSLEDEDVQPTVFDADKKLDVDQSAAEGINPS